MADQRNQITGIIRGRILRALQAAALAAGDRLPSTRELAVEFEVDYRVILAAYKQLEVEGLIKLRPRGGVYVALRGPSEAGVPPLPEAWFAEILTEGLAREIPGPELHEWLRQSTETLRLRAVAVASNRDQTEGLCRELHDDFGLESEGLTAEEVRGAADAPLPLRRADLVVTTGAHGGWVGAVADDLRKPLIVVEVRPELRGGDWAQLLRRPVYAVVATAEFGEMLRRFYADLPGIENLQVLVYGQDDLTSIPEDAPTYVTQRVRTQLGGAPIRGRILPAARTISSESAREIFTFIVRSNVEAISRRDR